MLLEPFADGCTPVSVYLHARRQATRHIVAHRRGDAEALLSWIALVNEAKALREAMKTKAEQSQK